MSSTSSKRQPKTEDAAPEVKAPEQIAIISAAAVGRVYPFAANQDIRYYLNGVALIPGKWPVIAATNGHMLYVEEDRGGFVSENLILRLSKRAAFFLKKGNKIVITRGQGKAGLATIIDGYTSEALYVEPGDCLIDGRFPNIGAVMGSSEQWAKGLVGSLAAQYLLQAKQLPGEIEFFHKVCEEPEKQATLFTAHMRTGEKGLGMIMPVFRGEALESYFPVALRPEDKPAIETPEAASA